MFATALFSDTVSVPCFWRKEAKNVQNPFNMVFLLKRWYFVRYFEYGWEKVNKGMRMQWE